MRANLLVVLLILLAGIGASLLLIPHSAELALQKFRDRDYDSARDAYEQRYTAGDRSGATVMPLTRLTLAQGDVERAIELTEGFLAAEPSSVEARELLDRLYQDAQRPGDRLENLKALAEMRNSADLFRELAYAAGFRNRMAMKAEALARYCTLRPEDVEAQQELAALLAARGDPAGAVDWLLRADDRATGNIQPDSRELLMSLLIDLDREDEAYERARRWLGERPTVADMIGLASQLAAAARPDLGLRLIEPQVIGPQVTGPQGEGRAPVLALELTYIDLLIATDRREQARSRLSALSGPVEDAQFGRLLALEVNAGMPRAALEATRGRDLQLVPDWVLAGLAETALRDGDRAFPDRLYRELGEDFLDDYPILAANIALGRGDPAAAAGWAERALAGDGLATGDRLGAIRILDRTGRRAAAVAAFDRLPLSGTVPEEVLEEMAALFIDFDRAPAGLAWFTARRQATPSPAAAQGWARLAAKAGDPAAVADWLAGQPKLPLALLQDIAGSAAERAASDPRAARPAAALALAAAQRAFALDPSARSRLALAGALTATGKPADALPLLAPLLDSGGAEVEAAYIAALDGAGRSEELARHLSAKLARGNLSDADQKAIVTMLLDHKAYRAALPLLRAWAERQGGTRSGEDWLSVYADAAAKANALPDLAALLQGRAAAAPLAEAEDSLYRDTLTKLGRKADLRRYLLARATDDRLPADRRREPVSALLALGDKVGAEQALQRLAAGQGPQSEDFRQLAYLWGPRPPASGLDWIEARAKAAGTPAEQAAWYDRLADYGGGRRVIAGLATQGAAPAQPALKTPYIEALAAAGKGKELADAVRTALAEEASPDRLRRYARLAEQTGQRAAASQAWTALLARKPDDADALRQLGMLAYDENRLADAERLLRRYVATGPNDYEAHYFLGEALTALKRPTAATPFYRTALSQLRARTARGDAAIQTEANLLNRLGKVDDAVALFEGLRKRRPADRQLKADYASMLIENGRLPEARRVLALP
ncbi:tetratricopeptide repeat protein [Azospirillum melinis]|uniref:Tetratricopeptide repeat protein n=1 Tax=Azospirillum melinis TaxID=328839 RepID=A0ABX2KIZ3_9PROT|nr:tetratricopeptide repeat protein [Azospirillum melinis]MBP2310644.1 lipopolysaccharide biosynthesis regulator YciM [Azospirillum melinis]NUB03560.1 tetratricopeptide repeat protein [Azospirillum melinis]